MNQFTLPRTPQHKICPIPGSLTSKDRAIISVYARFNLQALSSKCNGPTLNYIWTKHNFFPMDYMVWITQPYPNAHYDKNYVYNEECQGRGFRSPFSFDLGYNVPFQVVTTSDSLAYLVLLSYSLSDSLSYPSHLLRRDHVIFLSWSSLPWIWSFSKFQFRF